jgi:hypothetical protein
VLAQLQVGSLHFVGSQLYPAASAEDVGAETEPSCAATCVANTAARRNALDNMLTKCRESARERERRIKEM